MEIRYDQGKASAHVQHAERGDEGRHLQAGHQESVDEADEPAREDAGEHADGHGEIPIDHDYTGHDPGQGHVGPYGEVDATGDDDEGFPEAEQACDRRGDEDVDEVAEGKEVG